MAMSSSYAIPSRLSRDGIEFLINEKDWTKPAVTFIRFTGPVVIAIFSFIFYRLYVSQKRKAGLIKALWIWCYFHAANFCFGSTIIGLATNTGIWFGFQAQRYNEMVQIVVAIICIVCMLSIGFQVGRYVMLSANSRTLIKSENKSRFIMFSVVVPWLMGSLLLYLVKVSSTNFAEIGLFLTMGLMIVPIGNSYKSYPEILLVKDRNKRTFLWEYIALAIVLFIVFALVQTRGITI